MVSGVRTFGYYNAGQDCTAACRIYAGKGIYDKLTADLGRAVATIKYGTPDMDDVEIGPLISERQRSVLRASWSGHAHRTHRGRNGRKTGEGSGFFYEPTLIAGARQADEIVQKEVFGPVVSITRFTDPEDAVAWANDFALRSRLIGVDARHKQGHVCGEPPPIWLHLGQHAFCAHERNAAWRHEDVRLWQGHVGLRARGLHRRPARHGEVLIPSEVKRSVFRARGSRRLSMDDWIADRAQ